MKRLLEWKQRMLQSPLTRKSSASSTRGTSSDLSKYYSAKQSQLLRDKNKDKENEEEVERSEERPLRTEERGASRIQDGRRSAASLNKYNSYSSDDEGKRVV